MFETKQEAEETNSECAFCHLEKFVVTKAPEGGYNLEKCNNPDCGVHCHGGHTQTINLSYLNNQDAVAIASGW